MPVPYPTLSSWFRPCRGDLRVPSFDGCLLRRAASLDRSVQSCDCRSFSPNPLLFAEGFPSLSLSPVQTVTLHSSSYFLTPFVWLFCILFTLFRAFVFPLRTSFCHNSPEAVKGFLGKDHEVVRVVVVGGGGVVHEQQHRDGFVLMKLNDRSVGVQDPFGHGPG